MGAGRKKRIKKMSQRKAQNKKKAVRKTKIAASKSKAKK
jgi:hypothetical protein